MRREGTTETIMKKLFLAILLTALLTLGAAAQTSFIPPTVYVSNATTGIAWTAGTVNNGGHPVAVAAGSSTVTLNKNDCSSPGFANCNFVYSDNAGTVAVTLTRATAAAAGNTLLAMIETGATTTTQVVYPWQSGTMWLDAMGPSTTLTSPVISGGLTATGAGSNDFSGSTGTFKTSTGAVTIGPGAISLTGIPTFTAGLLASGAVSNDFSGATGTFKTSTGAVTVGPGAVDMSGQTTFSAGILASGAVANDFSGSTGTFKTSTGVNTFGGSSNSFTNAVTIAPTASLTLGTSGSAVGQLAFNNGTTGTVTLQPGTGALGSTVYTLAPVSGNVPTVQACGSTGSGSQTCVPTAATSKGAIFVGESTLAANTATITFPAPAFTSTTTYFCVANDVTTRANPVQMIPASASTATITNTTGATDVIQWICVGN